MTPKKEAKSFCRVCISSCGLIVETEGDRVVGVRGDRDHPLSQGYTCHKGRRLAEAHHDNRRLLHPEYRRGGRLVRSDWNTALDDVAAKLRDIMKRDGPGAIGIFLGGGGYMDAGCFAMAPLVTAALGTRQKYSDVSIDTMSKMLVPDMMAGRPALNSRPDYERCKLVVYIGNNPLVSHGHTSNLNNPTARLREMTRRGEVWVIDPRSTETAAKATRHLRPRPGTDYSILAYLIRELLVDGADWAYLAAHAQDVDALRAAVEPFSLARASQDAGVPASDLAELLATTRAARRLCVETGTGISMSRAANVTQWLSWALMIVTGSLDREGGAWINPGFLRQNDLKVMPLSPPEGTRGPGPPSRPELLTVIGEYPCVAMADEIASGRLKALLNLSGGLVNCLPQTSQIVPALGQLEVLATIDVAHNDTTALSTHNFPARHQFERADVSLGNDGSFPEVATHFADAIIPPPYDVRPYWWILAQIGKRIGLDFLPGIDPDTADDFDVLGMIAAGARRTLPEIRAAGYLVSEHRAIGWIEATVDRMGGWRLAPAALVAQLAEMKQPDHLMLISRRQPQHMNSRKMDMRAPPRILMNAEDAARIGARQDSTATVRSPHGEVSGLVHVDPTLPPGVLNVPHGWSGQYNVNQLTHSHDVDPLTVMPIFSGIPVSVSLYEETERSAVPTA